MYNVDIDADGIVLREWILDRSYVHSLTDTHTRAHARTDILMSSSKRPGVLNHDAI